jgi:glutamate synthase (NADPH/NADH) large chain
MTLEVDGKLMTARDVLIAAMLGAEEYSFASLALVSIGCVMMRVCSLNTCPVGIATQNESLRARFTGRPEHVKNMMIFIAESMREEMAQMGVRTIDELIGHADYLQAKFIAKGKAKTIDFSRMLNGEIYPIPRRVKDPFEKARVWTELDRFAEGAISNEQVVKIASPINNVDRAAGTRMAGWLAERYGNDTLTDGLIQYEYTGIAGQSFGAFTTKGMELKLVGEANDYVAKGMSGARIIVVPPADASYDFENTPIVGNVACFGASAGEAYFYGRAGERFCVRNSGANVVCEGVGDHGCEYMTGGVAVILGSTGRNFAAGMSGGVAYVYDPENTFEEKLNRDMVDLFDVFETNGDEVLHDLIEKHFVYTGSKKAKRILDNYEEEVKHFVKVYPKEFHHIQEIKHELEGSGLSGRELDMKTFEVAMKGGR